LSVLNDSDCHSRYFPSLELFRNKLFQPFHSGACRFAG
jgi:hypothetical protein